MKNLQNCSKKCNHGLLCSFKPAQSWSCSCGRGAQTGIPRSFHAVITLNKNANQGFMCARRLQCCFSNFSIKISFWEFFKLSIVQSILQSNSGHIQLLLPLVTFSTIFKIYKSLHYPCLSHSLCLSPHSITYWALMYICKHTYKCVGVWVCYTTQV